MRLNNKRARESRLNKAKNNNECDDTQAHIREF